MPFFGGYYGFYPSVHPPRWMGALFASLIEGGGTALAVTEGVRKTNAFRNRTPPVRLRLTAPSGREPWVSPYVSDSPAKKEAEVRTALAEQVHPSPA